MQAEIHIVDNWKEFNGFDDDDDGKLGCNCQLI